MNKDADIDGLAAEYALGALSPRERAEVAVLAGRNPQLGAAVAAWERRLAPLSLREPGLAPPAQALAGILTGIARQAVAAEHGGTVVVLRRRATAWRWVATGLAATVAALVAGIGWHVANLQPSRSDALVAVLVKSAANPTADEPELPTSPVFLATLEVRTRSLTVRQLAGRRTPAGRTHALWLREEGAPAALLGVVAPGDAATTFDLAARPLERLLAAGLLVSVEGATPGAAPRGPVISAGRLDAIAR